MMFIPEGTTHVWTPALEKERVQIYLRRGCYKRAHGTWLSYSRVKQCWETSLNDAEWFNKEREEGYFVTLDDFNNPAFVVKPENM